MVKYKEYFRQMVAENAELFRAFKACHGAYAKDKFANQAEFNRQGAAIRRIIEDWDRRLCSYMEGGQNASYSARLSEKFWDEARHYFPLIDFVGVKIRRAR